MATKIQVRRDTAANWTTAGGTILSAGEMGLETDTGKWKMGDGTRTWAQLTYQFPILTGSAGTVPDGTTLVVDQTNDRVGIGTATPAQKLDVVGTAAISGNTTIGGTLSAGATTLSGDLAVNAATNADITTTTSTATVFNTNATTLNIGGAATAVGIGAATGTTTINNATTAITGAATVGGTLAVTGNTTLTGDLAVNGANITTTATGTANVFNTNATTLNVGQAATTVSIGATTGTATIRNATTAITGAATVGSTLAVTGALIANGGINAVTFNGAPQWASNPTNPNDLIRKAFADATYLALAPTTTTQITHNSFGNGGSNVSRSTTVAASSLTVGVPVEYSISLGTTSQTDTITHSLFVTAAGTQRVLFVGVGWNNNAYLFSTGMVFDINSGGTVNYVYATDRSTAGFLYRYGKVILVRVS